MAINDQKNTFFSLRYSKHKNSCAAIHPRTADFVATQPILYFHSQCVLTFIAATALELRV